MEIETSEGDIVIELYNETPLHRDNFIKLVEEKFYDDLLFHRVIPDFMIQGGDPESRNARDNMLLGTKDAGYFIDPEVSFPRFFHKRGALAAARENDDKNPQRKSSGSQFYLIWGKTYSEKELKEIENTQNEKLLQQEVNGLFSENENLFTQTENNDDIIRFQQLMDSLRSEGKKNILLKKGLFHFPDSIRQIYQTLGGTPWLDNNYTVFGEVTQGLDIIGKIQSLPTNQAGRPYKNIKMKIRLLQ
ncbi:MAG: peptidylprolyl isomerase [Bacteroidales bacterium]